MFDFVEYEWFKVTDIAFSVVYLLCLFFYLYRVIFKNMLGYQYKLAKFLFKLTVLDLIISVLQMNLWAIFFVFMNGLIYLYWIDQEKKHFKIKEHYKKNN